MTKERGIPKACPTVLEDVSRQLSDFSKHNEHYLQVNIPTPDKRLGLVRRDKMETIIQEMSRLYPVQRIKISSTVSILVGTCFAAAPYTFWSVPYEKFAAQHQEKSQLEQVEEKSSQYFAQETLESPAYKKGEYVEFVDGSQKRVPKHTNTWCYVEVDLNGEKEYFPVDMYDLAQAKVVEKGSIRQLHSDLSELLPYLTEQDYSELFKQVLLEVFKQIDYFSEVLTKLYNEYIAPQLLALFEEAYQAGLIHRLPDLEEIKYSPEEMLTFCLLGFDLNHAQWETNRGPQSLPSTHFHWHIPSFRRLLVKLCSAQNDLELRTEKEKENFIALISKLEGLEAVGEGGGIEYLSVADIEEDFFVKHNDTYGRLISEYFLSDLRRIVRQELNAVLPENMKATVHKFKAPASKSSMQALNTSGLRITFKNSKKEQVIEYMAPIFQKFSQLQHQAVELYLYSLQGMEITPDDVSQFLGDEVDAQLVLKLLHELQPTTAMLEQFAKNNPEVTERLESQQSRLHFRMKKEIRNKMRLLLKENFGSVSEGTGTRTLIWLLQKKEIRVAVEEYLQHVFERKPSVAEIEEHILEIYQSAVRSEFTLDDLQHSHRIKLHTLVKRLYMDSVVFRKKNQAFGLMPGLVFSVSEEIQADGSYNTVCRLAVANNERGAIEAIWGKTIKRQM